MSYNFGNDGATQFQGGGYGYATRMFTFCSLSMTTYRVHLVSYLILGKKRDFGEKKILKKCLSFLLSLMFARGFSPYQISNPRKQPSSGDGDAPSHALCAVGVFLFLNAPSFFLRDV
jgi:hypothetical protein